MDRKGSGLIGLVLAPSACLQSHSAEFRYAQVRHILVTWFTSDRTVSFSMQSVTSSDFVPLAARVATAAWLSVQIVICPFAILFFRQIVTQSCTAATFTLKAVAFCPNEMCRCISLWYSQIPAPVLCWLQALSVNQTCPFLSQLGQSLS